MATRPSVHKNKKKYTRKMKHQTKLIFLGLLLILTACGSNKETVQVSETFLEESIKSSETIMDRTADVLWLKDLCIPDTLEKPVERIKIVPRTIYRELVVGGDTTKLSIENNELKLEIIKSKRVLQKKDSLIRNLENRETEKVEVVRYKYPLVFWLTIAYAVIVSLFCFRMLIQS